MSERNIKFRFLIIAFVFLVVGSALLFYGFKQTQENAQKNNEIQIQPTQQITSKEEIRGDEVSVSRVVDGDTIELSTGEKVRYIGIDTPETVDPRRGVGCFGKEASSENKKLVEGKNVLLAKDVSDRDKFDRLLRLVYLKKDDGGLLFVNDYLVRSGFAKASTYPPDVKFSVQFIEAEKEARENLRGLWQKCQ